MMLRIQNLPQKRLLGFGEAFLICFVLNRRLIYYSCQFRLLQSFLDKSIEQYRIVKGLDAIAEKSKKFQNMIEKFNSNIITNPVVAENFFSCAMLMNVKMKGVPVAVDMDEVCVYSVNNGKIVKEEFFYTPQTQEA